MPTLAEQLEARAEKRAAIVEQKRVRASERQTFGVTLMKLKNYNGAATCFADACRLWRENPVVHCDLATAYLYAGRFVEAEAVAAKALALDPKLVEARYVRGMSRKGHGDTAGAIVGAHIPFHPFSAAWLMCLDFETVLSMTPENTAAKTALAETQASAPAPDAEASKEATEEPVSSDPGAPTPDAAPRPVSPSPSITSDTSDAHHTASGIPCRFYNRGRCARKAECTFSHAPDDRSVRDGLGRNVCLYDLLGLCKFGKDKCLYSHDRSALEHAVVGAEGRWWESETGVATMRERLEKGRAEARERHAQKEARKAERREQREKDEAGAPKRNGEAAGEKKKKSKGKSRNNRQGGGGGGGGGGPRQSNVPGGYRQRQMSPQEIAHAQRMFLAAEIERRVASMGVDPNAAAQIALSQMAFARGGMSPSVVLSGLGMGGLGPISPGGVISPMAPLSANPYAFGMGNAALGGGTGIGVPTAELQEMEERMARMVDGLGRQGRHEEGVPEVADDSHTGGAVHPQVEPVS
ncbi:unnamed protein product [Mycena citricolor]|uniref:C3H1-type domain-containing protein n=1 Tax=Mycena citricolor TaxID=2018698 RepID=A0AAD2GUV5_9AGAR|nr:unnamed protein product [Mycena citricolor]